MVYRLEFEERGNLVVRKNDNEYIWESYTGDNKAKRIVVRPRYNNETNSALTFTKTDDFAGGNIVESYGSISNNFTKPYTLILTDDGILTIIDKNGKHTEALDFIATKGNVKPGDAFYCVPLHHVYIDILDIIKRIIMQIRILQIVWMDNRVQPLK